jgi:hypothetical protein
VEAATFKTPVSDTSVARRHRSNLFHNLFRGQEIETARSHSGRYITDNPPVRQSLPRWLDRLTNTLDTALSVGKSAIFLGEAGRREHDVGQPTGLSKKDILDNEKFQLLKSLDNMIGIASATTGFSPMTI